MQARLGQSDGNGLDTDYTFISFHLAREAELEQLCSGRPELQENDERQLLKLINSRSD